MRNIGKRKEPPNSIVFVSLIENLKNMVNIDIQYCMCHNFNFFLYLKKTGLWHPIKMVSAIFCIYFKSKPFFKDCCTNLSLIKSDMVGKSINRKRTAEGLNVCDASFNNLYLHLCVASTKFCLKGTATRYYNWLKVEWSVLVKWESTRYSTNI